MLGCLMCLYLAYTGICRFIFFMGYDWFMAVFNNNPFICCFPFLYTGTNGLILAFKIYHGSCILIIFNNTQNSLMTPHDLILNILTD